MRNKDQQRNNDMSARYRHNHTFLTRLALISALISAALLPAGCTFYRPLPLDQNDGLAKSVSQLLSQDMAQPKGKPKHKKIDPSDGLDLAEISIIAILNNPDLRVARQQAQVANAQSFAAGLLPDPQLSFSLDRPRGNGENLVDARSLSLWYDLIPLLTHRATQDVARHTQDKVRLDLLWQELQVSQQAQILAVQLTAENTQLQLLQQLKENYQNRFQRSSVALQHGDVTLDINSTDLTALVDTQTQISQLQQQLNQTRHQLNLILGLKPNARVRLTPLPVPTELDALQIPSQLAQLPQVRPDLLALQAGYASQEASVRGAILVQFPTLGITINRANDTGNIKTSGIGISLNLPFISGNRGNIAIERATRDRLHDEYQARLAQAHSEVDQLLNLQNLLENYQKKLSQHLPQLQQLAERATRAYDNGDIDALTFLNTESTWVNKRLELIQVEQAAWETRLALATVLVFPSGDLEKISTTSVESGKKP